MRQCLWKHSCLSRHFRYWMVLTFFAKRSDPGLGRRCARQKPTIIIIHNNRSMRVGERDAVKECFRDVGPECNVYILLIVGKLAWFSYLILKRSLKTLLCNYLNKTVPLFFKFAVIKWSEIKNSPRTNIRGFMSMVPEVLRSIVFTVLYY